MTQIYYEFTSDSYVTRHGDPDERWDDDDTSTTWTAPDTVSLTKIPYSEVDELPWEVKEGDTIYMVWLQYSTGNSFGQSDGEYHEVVGWYQNKKDADYCEAAIDGEDTNYSFAEGGNVVHVPTFDGQGTRPIYTGSWKGYFESLDHVSVQAVTVVE